MGCLAYLAVALFAAQAEAHQTVVIPKGASDGGFSVAVTQQNHLQFSTRSIDFGEVGLADSAGAWVDVTNISSQAATLSIAVEPPELAESGELGVFPSTLELEAGEQQRVLLVFRPLATTPYAMDLAFRVEHERVRAAHVETLSEDSSGAAISARGIFAFEDGTAFNRSASDERFCAEYREDFPTFQSAPADRRSKSARLVSNGAGLMFDSSWGHWAGTSHFWNSNFESSCDCDTECNLEAFGSWRGEALPFEGALTNAHVEFPHRAASPLLRDSGSVASNGARRWAQGIMVVGAVECGGVMGGNLQCTDTSLKISSGVELGKKDIGSVTLGSEWTTTPDRRSNKQELFAQVQCKPCARAYNVAVQLTGLAADDIAPLRIRMTATGPNVNQPLSDEVEITPQGDGEDSARAFTKRVPNRSTVTLTSSDARCPGTRVTDTVADGDLELTFRCGARTVDAKVKVQGGLGVGSAQVRLSTTLDTTRNQVVNVDKAGDFKFPSAIPKGSDWTVELGELVCAECTLSATPSIEGNNLTRDLQVVLQCEENAAEGCGAEISTFLTNDKVSSAEATMTATLADGTALPPSEMSLTGQPQLWPGRLPEGATFDITVTSAESDDPANPEVKCSSFGLTVGQQDRIAANINCTVMGGDPDPDSGGGDPDEDEDIEHSEPTPDDCLFTPGRCGTTTRNCVLRSTVVETTDQSGTTITTTYYWDCTGGDASVYPWGGTPDFDVATQVWTWEGPEVAVLIPQAPLEGLAQLSGTVSSAHTITRFEVSIDGQPAEDVDWNGADFTVHLDTFELADGPHAIAVLAWSDAPMYTYPGFAFEVDNSVERPAICDTDDSYPVLVFEPGNGRKIAPGDVTISGEAADPSGLDSVVVWVDGQQAGSFDSASFSLETSLALGNHEIVVLAEDVCGKMTQQTHEIEVTDDLHSCQEGVDTLVWTSPTGGEPLVAGQSATLRVAANDADGIDKVEFWAGATFLATVTSPPWELPWVAELGVEQVGAIAFDPCGYSTMETAPVTVLDDSCNGVVETTLLAPASGSEVTVGSNVLLSASASASHGISRVQFFKMIGNVDILIGEDLSADPPGGPFGPYWMTWSPTASDLGVTGIKARAFSACEDGATEFAESSKSVAVLDPTACDGSVDWVAFASPPHGATLEAGTPVTVSAQAGDTQGLSVIRFYKVLNGSEIQIGEVAAALAPIQPVAFDWTPGPGDVNVSQLRARAFSACGNGLQDSALAVRSVTIEDSESCDGSVDSVLLTQPGPQQQLFRGSLITLTATATDAQGISKIQFWKTSGGNESLIAERIGDQGSYNWIPTTADLGVSAITARAYSACGDGSTDSGIDANAVTVIEGCDGVVDSVQLSSPINGAQLTAGVPVSIAATAADGQGISSVRFYRMVGSSEIFLGLSTGSPASMTWTPSGSQLDTTGIKVRAYSACGSGFDDTGEVVHGVAVSPP